jgi:DNA-binding LytR/AlgR family response regulator
MNILIIEDEIPASHQLKRLINDYNSDFNVVAEIDSVKSAISWFSKNNEPDLIFMDIQLGDGLSFEIFDYCVINSPVIFTTAYDKYAIQAFKVNSIDYLLKPFDKDDIARAIEKFETLNINKKQADTSSNPSIEKVLQLLNPEYKSRFIVKVGEHLHSVKIDDILYFVSVDKVTYLQNTFDKRLIIDQSIENLSGLIDPQQFYRINRKYLINIDAIEDMVSYSNSRLRVKLTGSSDDNIIVSREKVQDFKTWLDR